MPLDLPGTHPAGGVALLREWVADRAQVSLSGKDLDALLVDATEPAEFAGLFAAVLRLDLPAVLAAPLTAPFAVALAALGFAPLNKGAARVAVDVARAGAPRPREVVEGFSLANALRAGLVYGGGPELLVHLAAIAREAGAGGFPQMIRVLTPESPKVANPGSSWSREHGAAGLFAYLGDALHDTPMVEGRLKENLPPVPPAPEATSSSRLVFVRGRASGTEVLCRVEPGARDISGSCRFFASEEEAIRAVGNDAVEPTDLLVVAGCGPRGAPGLLRLGGLGDALSEAGLHVPVLTDGLPPDNAASVWASLAAPETAVGGVLWRLRDGDSLRLDLEEGLIRTGVKAEEVARREPLAVPVASGFGYAARYARAALPALEGAGFG